MFIVKLSVIENVYAKLFLFLLFSFYLLLWVEGTFCMKLLIFHIHIICVHMSLRARYVVRLLCTLKA